jgi:hypothetical protein
MYAMLLTRPDTAFSIQWLCRHLAAPQKAHLLAAKGLLKYLKGTSEYAITYWPGPNYNAKSPLSLIGYADSDYAGDKDSSKSTYGYLVTLYEGPIAWKSKRAPTIALSTVEAESDATLEALRELQWLSNLFIEVNYPVERPITLYNDNQGAISKAYNPNQHSRTKHTLLKHRYIQQEVGKGLIRLTYLPTNQMAADGLTKPLPAPKHREFLRLLGLGIPPTL